MRQFDGHRRYRVRGWGDCGTAVGGSSDGRRCGPTEDVINPFRAHAQMLPILYHQDGVDAGEAWWRRWRWSRPSVARGAGMDPFLTGACWGTARKDPLVHPRLVRAISCGGDRVAIKSGLSPLSRESCPFDATENVT
eukprot:gene34349-11676_t